MYLQELNRRRQYNVLLNVLNHRFFAEGDGQGAEGKGAEGKGAEGKGAEGKGAEGKGDDKKFTQEDVNRFLADERRKHEQRTNAAIAQLEEMKGKANLTEKERADLETKLEQMRAEVTTKEEQAKRAFEKATRDNEKLIKGLQTDVAAWKDRFESTLRDNAIAEAALKHGAYSVAQVRAMLIGRTKVEPILTDKGEPTGTFKVSVNDKSSDGKDIVLTVDDAVKTMKESDDFANLFKGGTGGTGTQRSAGNHQKYASIAEAAKAGPEAYREYVLAQQNGKKK